ncbi:hypothetical protein SAMN05661099_0791 [Daejeonella lutea]|uniref:Uncharacterized protein n=1 Tax=Daejeonella lutea TaxID=572036 RepID=A0A1T5AJQ9_9SPHI|nr:hypothetical protein SAMN05661099_0791 [Daejeonella lutea]
MPADWHLLFLQLKSKQKAVAAPAAVEGTALAWLMLAAPADAKES